MIFIIVSFILSLLAIFEKKVLFNVSALIVGLYFSLNYGYGYDWINYRDTFIHSLDKNYTPFFFEPGLYYLMKLGLWIGMSYAEFVFFVTAFIYGSTFLFCRRFKNPSLAFFTLFSFLGIYVFNEWIRQGIAICLLMFATIQINNNNNKGFFLLVFTATFFHISSIVALLYLFMRRNDTASMKKFIILSSLFVFSLLFALYNSFLFSWIPFIGDKIYAYGMFLLDNDLGFWDYIFSSRVLLAYVLLFLFFFIKRNGDVKIYSVINSFFIILLTRLAQTLIRIGYCFVPFFVLSVDQFMASQGKGFKTSLNKCVYIIFILGVGTIPAWSEVFWYGSLNSLNIMSSTIEINHEIANKCRIINKYYVTHTIERCR